MDCFRSGLDGPAWPGGAEPVFDALDWGAAAVLPKKSRPSRESPALVSFGGAAADLGGGGGGGLVVDGPVVFGRAGGDGVLSPKRSIFCVDRLG